MAASLAVLIAAQTIYMAKLDSFGCTSPRTVSDLQKIRTEEKTFQTELYKRIFQGECILIMRSTLVEGSLYDQDSSMMLVNRSIQPPGYVAPSDDFELKGEMKKTSAH